MYGDGGASTLALQAAWLWFWDTILPRVENKAADALSRHSVDPQLAAISIPLVLDLEKLQQEVEADDHLAKVRLSI